jgi:XisI protein
MDRVNEYRSIVKQVLDEYYQLYSESEHPNFETFRLCDESQDQYLLMRLGWDGERRVNRNVIHLRLLEGKVWVEEDWTEQGVATDLLAAGVPREAIVLGFQPPHLREYTEFAAA